MEIYITSSLTKEEAEKKISGISSSAEQSIEMGYPAEHGGFYMEAENGYIAQTSGGVIYGFIKRSVGGGLQSCAILGYHRQGSLSDKLDKSGWKKTTAFEWLEGFSRMMDYGKIQCCGHLRAPSNLDINRLV